MNLINRIDNWFAAHEPHICAKCFHFLFSKDARYLHSTWGTHALVCEKCYRKINSWNKE